MDNLLNPQPPEVTQEELNRRRLFAALQGRTAQENASTRPLIDAANQFIANTRLMPELHRDDGSVAIPAVTVGTATDTLNRGVNAVVDSAIPAIVRGAGGSNLELAQGMGLYKRDTMFENIPKTSELSGEMVRHAAELVGTSPETQQQMEQVGASLPRALAGGTAAAFGGPIGFNAMLGDAALQGYSREHNLLEAGTQAATVGVAGKVVPAVGQAASRWVADAVLPSAESLSSLPGRAYAQAVTAPGAITQNAIAAGRLGAEALTGTAVNEVGRMANEIATGKDVQAPTIQSLAASAVQSAALAPFDIAMQTRAGNSPKDFYSKVMKEREVAADKIRQMAADYRGKRGERMADTHQAIFDAARLGQDITPLRLQNAGHYDEALGDYDHVGRSMLAFNAAADGAKNMSDLQVANLINAVTGKFDNIVEDDPTNPLAVSGAAVVEMMRTGHLPQLSDEFVKSNWPEAYKQGLGDNRVVNENIVNRIVNHYQELLPDAVQAYKSMPRPDELTKSTLDARYEAGRDDAYINAIVSLQPHMSGMQGPNKQPLDQAFYARDRALITATQGRQLETQGPAWAKYDAWRDDIIRFASSYDPVTRTGEWAPTLRLQDGTVVQREPERVSIEALVEKAPDSPRYLIRSSTGKRAAASKQPLTNKMMEYLDTRNNEGTRQKEKLNAMVPGDLRRAADLEETEAYNAPEPQADYGVDFKPTETTPPEVKSAWDAATKAGLTGQQRADYIKKTVPIDEAAIRPFFSPSDSNPRMEVATFLASRIESTENLALWNKFGGKPVFGNGALSPGKAQNFKNALLSRIEWEALPKSEAARGRLKELTPTQQDFLKTYQEGKLAKGETPTPLPGTWAEQAKLFRDAQRLYWGQNGDKFPATLEGLLSDKPALLQTLHEARNTTSLAQPTGIVSDSMMSTRGQFFRALNNTDPQLDTVRLFYGYAKKVGLPDDAAQDYALLSHKITALFPEVGSVGNLTGTTAQGINLGGRPGGRVGVNFERIKQVSTNQPEQLTRALSILAHELTHSYSHIGVRPDSAFMQARYDAHNKLKALFESLGQTSSDRLFDAMSRIFTPRDYKLTHETSIASQGQGLNFSDEAVSKLMEMVVLGAVTQSSPQQGQATRGAKYKEDAFLWLPQDVQAYANLAYRDLSNFTGGLQYYYDKLHTETPTSFEAVRKGLSERRDALANIMSYANEFVGATAERQQLAESVGKLLLSDIQASGPTALDPSLIVSMQRLDETELARISASNKISFAKAAPSTPGQQPLLSGQPTQTPSLLTKTQKQAGVHIPEWSKLFGQFYQSMYHFRRAGIGPIAENAMRIVNGLEPAYWRLIKDLHSPFTMIDSNGVMKYDPNHPVQVLLRGKEPQAKRGLQALEELRIWAVDNQKPIVDTDPTTGKTIVHQDAQQIVAQTIGNLKPEIQQGVLEGIKSLRDGYQRSAEMRYGAEIEKVAYQVAKFFMIKSPMPYDAAFNDAKLSVESGVNLFRAQKVVDKAKADMAAFQQQVKTQPQLLASPQAAQLAQQLLSAGQNLTKTQGDYVNVTQNLSPEQTNILQNYVLGPAGAAGGLVDMADMFVSRRDWFMSEQRPGKFLIYGKTPNGDKYANGKRTKAQADALVKDLAKQGYQDLDIIDRELSTDKKLFDSPDEIVNSYMKLEQGAWANFMKQAEQTLSPQDYAALEATGYEPGLASQKFVQNKSLDRYLLPSKAIAGREDLDSFEVFHDYTRRLVGSVARRGVKQQMDLLLRDPSLNNNNEFKGFVNQAVDTLMQPVGEKFQTVRAAITSYFLGFANVPAMLTESTQALSTVLPRIIREDGDFSSGVARFAQAPIEMYKIAAGRKTLVGRQIMSQAKYMAANDPQNMTKEQAYTLYYQKALEDGAFSHGVVQESMHAKDSALFSQYGFGMGSGPHAKTGVELAEDMTYRAAQLAMALYTPVSTVNNKIAFMAGVSLYYDKGFRGDDLYRMASVFKDTSTYGGGKANEVGYVNYLSNPRTRPYFALVNTLQRFGFGYITDFMDNVRDSSPMSNLPGTEKAAARKALITSQAAIIGLGGVMAIPGAAILAALMAKLFDVDVKQEARQLEFDIAKKLGADDPMAVGLANLAQNGVGGQFLGTDLSARYAVNSYLGFDSFEGFDTTNLVGPSAGVAERLFKAGQYVADRKFVQAGKMTLPPSLAPAFEVGSQLAAGEQPSIRTESGKLIGQMTPTESLKYAVGMKPYWYRTFRDQQQNKIISERAADQNRNREVDEAATQLRAGNVQPLNDYVNKQMSTIPTATLQTRQALVKGIIDRALVQTNAIDLMATTPQGQEQSAQAAAQTFGNANRQSEIGLAVQREKLNALTGYQGGPSITEKGNQALERAALVDSLVKQGKVRTEAERQADLILQK